MIYMTLILTLLASYLTFRIYNLYFSNYKKIIVMPIVAIIILLFVIIKLFERFTGFTLPIFLTQISYVVVGLSFYMLFLIAVIDILRLTKVLPRRIYIGYQNYFSIAILLLSFSIFLYGYNNAQNVIVKYYDIKIDKPMKNTKVALISDLHIDAGVSVKNLDKHVNDINEFMVDFVIIAGDLVDNNIRTFTDDYKNVLRKFNTPVYLVLGNHEYYSGEINHVINEYKSAGINVLRDEYIYFDDKSLYLVGRDDVRHSKNRKNIRELLSGVDKNKAIVLVDHVPLELGDVISSGVDVQLSGHTHDGQFFPVTLVVKFMYPLSQGLKRMNENFQLLVTSGLGLWGPPIRVGTDAEIVIINFKGA